MTFDEILEHIYLYDSETTAFDNLFVFIKYTTGEKWVFHNPTPDEINQFMKQDEDMIMLGYNDRSYDKYILQAVVNGFSPTEVKEVNDAIIRGHNGYNLDIPYTILPPQMDLLPEIVPRKSLKELEGNLRMNITETTVDFNIDHAWTEQELQEMIYYCTKDVEALKPVFDILMKKFKAKYMIAKISGLDPVKAICKTNTALTAIVLGAQKQEHNDGFLYEFPPEVEKDKIPHEILEFIETLREHNDEYETYKSKVGNVDVKFGDCEGKVGLGGQHFAKPYTFLYGKDEVFKCD